MEPKAKQNPESAVKEIKRNTRRKFNSEEKIRIILEGRQVINSDNCPLLNGIRCNQHL
jgi:hypothetical protein